MEIAHLKLQLKTRKENSDILSLGSNGQKVLDNKLSWTHQFIPLNERAFGISDDQTVITIKEAGIYRFDVKLLNRANSQLYPYLAINNAPIMYFYSSGPVYSDATLGMILSIQDNSNISVQFQGGYSNLYTGSNDPKYSYFSIQRLN